MNSESTIPDLLDPSASHLPPKGFNFRRLLVVLKWLIIAAVLVGLGIAFAKAFQQLREHRIDWSQLQWWRLLAAIACYSITLLISGSYWRSLLVGGGVPVLWIPTLRAFAWSQLGKYLPGKGMVVVLRTGMVQNMGVPIGSSVATTFIETLLWMFSGAQIASVLLILFPNVDSGLRLLAVIVFLVSGIVTLPPVFNRIVVFLAKVRGVRTEQNVREKPPVLNWRHYIYGVASLSVGWLFAGSSAWLVATAIPTSTIRPEHFVLILATISLATVGGFASMLPGGIGVRELVIVPLLSPVAGVAVALVIAIVIRLCWMMAELVTSVTIEVVYRMPRKLN